MIFLATKPIKLRGYFRLAVLEELKAARTKPYNWKWVVIALHNALQGFMVLALRFTNPTLIARVPQPLRKWNDELIAAYNQRQLVKDLPEEVRKVYMKHVKNRWSKSVPANELQTVLGRINEGPVELLVLNYELVAFPELFKRVTSDRYMSRLCQPMPEAKLSDLLNDLRMHESSVDLLNRLRNEYIHFTPKTLVTHLNVIQLPLVVQSCLEVIQFLLECGSITWHLEDDEENLEAKATQLIEETRQEVRAIATDYGLPL